MHTPNRVVLSLFGFPIYWYGLLIAVGLVLGVICASMREKKLGLKKDTSLDFLLVALPAALLCARIYYVVFSWENYAGHPLSIFNLREGGLAIYGGVIGGILAALVFSKWRKVPFGALADLCAPALALGQAIGRWGNFFNQEAYGIALSNPSLHFFPAAVYIEADGLWHAAAFFYESMWCLLICAAMLIGEQKGFFRRRGDLFTAYLFLYAAERVIVEGLRTDSLMLGAFRISQLLSGALMLGVMLWILRRHLSARSLTLFCAGAVLLGLLGLSIHRGWFAPQVPLAVCLIISSAMLYHSVSPATGQQGSSA